MSKVVSYSEVFGKGDSGGVNWDAVVKLSDVIGQCIDIVKVDFFEGKYGPYVILTDVMGKQYSSSSRVIMDQAKKIVEYLRIHPDTISVRVKVAKIKNYYAFTDCDEGGELPPGVVSWSDVSGRKFEQTTPINTIIGQVITITGYDTKETQRGTVYIIHAKEGEFHTFSRVIGDQLAKLMDVINTNPDIDGIRVKVEKVRNYLRLGDPSD